MYGALLRNSQNQLESQIPKGNETQNSGSNPSRLAPPYASFYLRDDAFLMRLSTQQRKEFDSESQHAKKKMNELKKVIRSSRYPNKVYVTPDQLCKLVHQDLLNAINKHFGPEILLDTHEKENFFHEQYAKSFTDIFVGGAQYSTQVDKLQIQAQQSQQQAINQSQNQETNISPNILIVGDSGVGKTALMSNLYYNFKMANPNSLVVSHFIGATTQSSSHQHILQRIIIEIKKFFEIEREIPHLVDCAAEFQGWLRLIDHSDENQIPEKKGLNFCFCCFEFIVFFSL